jgi:hypothetical protein
MITLHPISYLLLEIKTLHHFTCNSDTGPQTCLPEAGFRHQTLHKVNEPSLMSMCPYFFVDAFVKSLATFLMERMKHRIRDTRQASGSDEDGLCNVKVTRQLLLSMGISRLPPVSLRS